MDFVNGKAGAFPGVNDQSLTVNNYYNAGGTDTPRTNMSMHKCLANTLHKKNHM